MITIARPFVCLLIGSLLSIAAGPLLAQDSDSVFVQMTQDTTVVRRNIFHRGIIHRITTDGVNTFGTIVQTYARPFHWQKRDLLYLGGALAVSASALLVEKPVYNFMLDHQTPTLDKLENVGYLLGRPQLNYPIMFALWGSGVLINNNWLRNTGILVIASVTTSGLIQTASKELFGRARPGTGRGNVVFEPFGGPPYHSFPSGHATLATATFWVLARQVDFVPLKVVFYSLPLITGASRIYAGMHWLSDVLLGTALGVACAESVLRLYPVIKAKRAYSVNLVPSLNGAGLVVRF